MKILVLCTGNSCRSQMAEGILRHLAVEGQEVFSAGIEAHGLNPLAVKVMAEIGLDISQQSSDLVGQYLGIGITHVITVCDNAAAHCPHFPEHVVRSHFSFPDPAKAVGSEAERLPAFREVRDQIQAAMRTWWIRHS
jgi:arsenate reductase (thioredoxin)